MSPKRVLWPVLLALVLAAGCQPSPTPTAPAAKQGATRARPEPQLIPTTTQEAPVVAPLAPRGAGLIGKVKAPASLIGNNGANMISDRGLGVVSNNGGSLISDKGLGVAGNNGGSYRALAAEAQVPVAGAEVALLKADGRPVLGSDGQPLTTETDESGGYAFPVSGLDHNVLVVTQLPSRGQLAAFVPKRPAGDAPATVDVDLVSTLSTGYIVNVYVQPQADPQAVLDKLSPALEAATRQRLGAALAAGHAPVPPVLDRQRVIEAVGSLRGADAALNDQLSTVRCQLVAAGPCDLGEGSLGTDVRLLGTVGLLLAPEGALYMGSLFDSRVWRLDADGRARKALDGLGWASLESEAAATALSVPVPVGLDAAGRLLVLDQVPATNQRRLSRLELDDRLTHLWTGDAVPRGVFGGGGDAVQLLTASGEVLEVAPGQEPRPTFTFAAADQPILRAAKATGQDPQGRLYMLALVEGARTIYRFDPASQRLVVHLKASPAGDADAAAIRLLTLDRMGNAIYQTASGQVRARRWSGEDLPLLEAMPEGRLFAGVEGVALGVDGTAYLAYPEQIHRLRDGKMTRAMGLDPGAPTTAVNLNIYFGATTIAPDGTKYTPDALAHRVWRITPDGKATVFAGTDATGHTGDGGPATAATFHAIWQTGIDPERNVYLLDADRSTVPQPHRLRRVDPEGTITTVYQDTGLADFAIAPSGAVYVLLRDFGPAASTDSPPAFLGCRLGRLDGAGTLTEVRARDEAVSWTKMTAGPDGALYLSTPGKVHRWLPGGETTLVSQDPLLAGETLGGLALGPDGRLYVTVRSESDARVVGVDPVTGAARVLAGAGGDFFTGTGTEGLSFLAYGPAFDAHGHMFVPDAWNRQLKVIPAGSY